MGPTSRRQKELEQRKQLILSKSRELFFAKGFDGVTIQDICEAVEYGRSAIYALFESKEEIYSHIYLEALCILLEISNSTYSENDDFENGFMKIGQVMYQFSNEHTDYFKAISHFSTKAKIKAKIPYIIMEEKERLYNDCIATPIQLLHDSISQGIIKAIDPHYCIMIFMSGLIGIRSVLVELDEIDPDTVNKAVIMQTQIYRDGLKK